MTAPTVLTVKAVSNKLLLSLLLLIVALIILFVVLVKTSTIPTLPVVLIFGAIGAFVSLQRRLKSLTEEDLLLLKESITYTWLAPMTGALLAGVLYLLFIAHLLEGQLFPKITTDSDVVKAAVGIAKITKIESGDAIDYAKLLFWSFIAGFSESFVTNIIGRFESKG